MSFSGIGSYSQASRHSSGGGGGGGFGFDLSGILGGLGGIGGAIGGFPLGAGLGLLGGIGGAIQGHKAQKQQKQQFERWLSLYQKAQRDAQAYNSLARSQQQAGLGDLNRYYGMAQQLLQGAGAEGVQAATDAGRQARSGAMASSYARGLQNTSAGQNMLAQADYQTQRNVGGVTQRIAALRAQLAAQQGRAVAGQRNQIGAGYQQQGQQGLQSAAQGFNMAGSYEPIVDTGALGLIGQAGAMFDQYQQNKNKQPSGISSYIASLLGGNG